MICAWNGRRFRLFFHLIDLRDSWVRQIECGLDLCTHTHTHTHTRTHTHTHAHTHAHIHTHVHTHTRTHTRACANTHTRVYTRLHTHVTNIHTSRKHTHRKHTHFTNIHICVRPIVCGFDASASSYEFKSYTSISVCVGVLCGHKCIVYTHIRTHITNASHLEYIHAHIHYCVSPTHTSYAYDVICI